VRRWIVAFVLPPWAIALAVILLASWAATTAKHWFDLVAVVGLMGFVLVGVLAKRDA
jgi:hypothetical protein